MNSFISGITGFAGQYLAEHLLKQGDNVLGCSRNGQWQDGTSAKIRREVGLMSWDLRHAPSDQTVQRIKQFSPDCIYHLAAISNPRQCGTDRPSPLALAVNVQGTRHVLALAEVLAPQPTVLLSSSAHVQPVGPAEPRVDEAAALQPVSTYGTTKLLAEQACLRARQRGLPTIVVRPFPHTGPGQRPDFILPAWTRQFAAQSTGPVQVYTTDCHLDLSDVRDVVRAYQSLVVHRALGIFNVGSGKRTSGQEIMGQLQMLTGNRRSIIETRPGTHQHSIADITRLIRATGWQPSVTLDQTITDTMSYWRDRLAVE